MADIESLKAMGKAAAKIDLNLCPSDIKCSLCPVLLQYAPYDRMDGWMDGWMDG
jgi:hypothetical protein